MTTLWQKQVRHVAAAGVGAALVRPVLAELYRLEQPNIAVNDAGWLAAA